MWKSPLTLLVLLAAALPAGAHSEGYPVDPRPAGVGGGGAGAVPTLPPGGATSPGAAYDDGPAFDWAAWWRWNRETLIDLPALRRARRARAGLAVDPAPGMRDRAVLELMLAAKEPAGSVSDAALVALGRAGDGSALLAPARKGNEAALIGLGLLAPTKESREVLLTKLGPVGATPRRRAIAALAVGLSGDLAALPALLARVKSVSEPAMVTEACLVAIAALGSDAACRDLVPLLALKSGASDRQIRRAALAAFALGRIRAREVTGPMRRGLRSPYLRYRRQAALSLGALAAAGSDAARDLGIVTTGHPVRSVRGGAALGLAQVAHPDSAGPLKLVLRQDALDMRAVAALGLAIWGPREAAPVLEAALPENADPSVRGAIAAAMGVARRPGVIPKLRPLLTEFGPAQVRGHAALALAILGDGPSRASIRALLHPPAPITVRIDAALAAGLLGDPAAEKEAARRLMEEDTERGRTAAAIALGWIGSPDTIPVLIRVLRDHGNPETVRAVAAISLGRILDARSRSPATRLAAGMDPTLPSDFLREVLRWF